MGSGPVGDAATGIALDCAGNAYLTGYTSSSDFPTIAGEFQRTYSGGEFDADRLDVGVIADIASRLPIGAALRHLLYLFERDEAIRLLRAG